MSRVLDYAVLGQGLAGSWVATVLAQNGRSVAVVDAPLPGAASRVASGLMTPLTGKRLVPSFRVQQFLPAAMRAYEAQERELGCSLIDRRPSLRVFRDADQAARWDLRAKDPSLQPYLGERFAPGTRAFGVQLPFGGCLLLQTARIEVQRWLAAVRHRLALRGELHELELELSTLRRHEGWWQVGPVRARRVVLCLGHRARDHAWTADLPYRHARGDLVEVEMPRANAQVHLQAGVSLTILGDDRGLIGGNYDWREVDGGPNEAHKDTLCARMQALVGRELAVLGHRSGVRPIVEGRVPVLGSLSGHEGAFVLNGLASKGTMWAPWMAAHLVEVMERGRTPDPAFDIQLRRERFAKRCRVESQT